MTTFTASEVREELNQTFRYRVNAMLDAYAERLEADEKAVPVYQHRSKNGSMLRWFDCSEETFMAMEHNKHDREHFDRRILYTHPAPADADRLAEALRKIAREPVKPWPDPFAHSYEAFAYAIHATWCDINRIAREALAAHAAQAQSQAASGPEVELLRAFSRDVLRAWPDGGIDGGDLQDLALKHGLLEPSVPTQEERDEWGLVDGDDWYRRTSLIAVQENPNG